MQSATLPEIIVPRTPEPPRTAARSEQSGTPFAATLDQVHQDQARTAKPTQDDADQHPDQASRPTHESQDDAEETAESGAPGAKSGKPAPARPGKADTTDQALGDPSAPVILPTAPVLPALPVEAAPTVLASAPAVPTQPLPGGTLPGEAPAVPGLVDKLTLPLPALPAPTAAAVPPTIPGTAGELPATAKAAALAAQVAALAHAVTGAAPAAAAKPASTGTAPGADVATPVDAGLIATLTTTPGEIAPAKDAKVAKDATGPEATAASGDAGAAAAAAIQLPTPVVSAASAPASRIQASAITIGDKAKKVAAETTTSETATAKSGSAFDAVVQQVATAPTAPTAPVQRPLSETIAAQDALANAGNAAEKAVSQQVGKALVQTLPGGDKMMVLRLTPPELGTVRIEVVEHQGVMSARLHAEDDGVRVALERFLPQMQRDLRAQDAPIQEVTLSDQTQFDRSFADTSRQPRDQDGSPRSGRGDGPAFAIDGAARSDDPISAARALGGRINARGVDAFA